MRRAGFTLLEVLVTLVIVVLFSSAVYAVFLGAVVNTRWVQDTTAAARSGQSILRLMERDLMSCVARAGDTVQFTGFVDASAASGMTFITASDSRSGEERGPSDLTRVTYLVSPDETDTSLLRLHRKEEPSAGLSLQDDEEYVLLERSVRSFELEFFDGSSWFDVWDDPEIPRAVQVSLVLQRQVQESATGEADGREFEYLSVVMIPAGG